MDSKGSPRYFRSFWTRRVARIFPVYYLIVLLPAALRWVNGIFPNEVARTLGETSLAEGYFVVFAQNIAMAVTGNGGSYVNGVTWSLAIEEQFYLVFPFIVFFVPRRWLVVVAIAVILATPLIRALVVAGWGWKAGYLLTVARADALMLGVLLAALVRHAPALGIARQTQRPLNWVALLLIALQLGDVWGYAAEQWRLSLGGNISYLTLIVVQYPLINFAMATLMLNIFTRDTGPLRWIFRTKFLTALGLISYGAYMYHQTINYGLWRFLNGSLPQGMGWEQAYIPTMVLVLTGLVSWCSLRYFEMPIRRWITEYSIAETPAAIQPAAIK